LTRPVPCGRLPVWKSESANTDSRSTAGSSAKGPGYGNTVPDARSLVNGQQQRRRPSAYGPGTERANGAARSGTACAGSS